MTTAEDPSTRPGSGADLSRRMDRLEQNHEALAATVSNLAGTVSRVELNQTHQAELTKLRFDALDVGLGTVKDTLERFMGRINAIITGEVQLPQNTALMADWREWRRDINEKQDAAEGKLDEQDVLNGQVRLLGRLAVLLVTSQLVTIGAAVYALVRHTTP